MISAILAGLLLTQAPSPPAPLVPVEWIVQRDDTPLDEQKRRLVGDALDLETDALHAQSALPVSKAENVAADLRRIEALRTLLNRRIDPNRISPRALSLLDRFLVRFALDRLEGEGADVAAVELWTDANRRFLASKQPADRAQALQARFEALQSMATGAILRRFLLAVEDGSLDEASRRTYVVQMQEAFPDAPLPTTALATAPLAIPLESIPTAAPGASPAPGSPAGGAASLGGPIGKVGQMTRQAGSESLPRLDGIERPLGEVATVEQLIAAMRGGR